jgi:hypothetical protein
MTGLTGFFRIYRSFVQCIPVNPVYLMEMILREMEMSVVYVPKQRKSLLPQGEG